VEPLRIRPRITGLPISGLPGSDHDPVDTHEPTIGLNGPPIDFAAYHFDPHTLLAVLLLSLAIAILFMTALIPDKQMRNRKAFRHILARMRVRRRQRRRRKSKGNHLQP
jgi:hypothetical protein